MRPTNSGSDTAGGARAFMQPTLGENFAPRFQTVTDSLEIRRTEFRRLWADAVRKLRPYAVNQMERRVLDDAARGRMSMVALETICTIAAREPMPFVLQETVERAVFDRVTHHLTPCAFEASEQEQRTNEVLNLAQLRANKEKSPARWQEVAEYCGPQIHATITLRDAAWAKSQDGAR